MKDEGVAFADADSLQGREGFCKQGTAHSVSPRFCCDRKMVDVAAAAVGAAEDGPDEVSPGYDDAAQTRVAGQKFAEPARTVGVAQSEAFGPLPQLERRIDVAGNEFSKLKTIHGHIQRLDCSV